jgi:hypothetical protein
MALPSYYNTGTATVASGGTAVTGQGTAWLNSVKAGDRYGTHKGLPIRILSVNSNTSLTLAYAAPALLAQTAAAYEIAITPVASEIQASVRALLETLSNGNLSSIAELTSAADKLAYFDGVGSSALTNLTPAARAVLALAGAANKLPYLTGANTAALADFTGFARNILDDADGAAVLTTLGMPYEKGSFTPGVRGLTTAGSPSYVSQLGNYVRIGDLVMAYTYVVATSLGTAAGQLALTGLPFSVGPGTNRRSLFMPSFWGGLSLPAGSLGWFGFGIDNDTTVRLYRTLLTSGSSGVDASHVSGTLTIYGTTVYEKAAG